MEQAFNIFVFVVFGLLWVGFAVALIASQGSLHDAWQWIGSLHLLAQVGLWILFLPVMAGLWIWESGWPVAVRLILVLGIGFFNLYIFFPFRGSPPPA